MAPDTQRETKELGFGSRTIRVPATQICIERRVFIVDVSADLVALLPADWNLPVPAPGVGGDAQTTARVVVKERPQLYEDHDPMYRGPGEQYDRELETYTTRLGPLQGRYVPRLYGQLTSLCTDVNDDNYGSHVPAMLLEYIDGSELGDFDIDFLASPHALKFARDFAATAPSGYTMTDFEMGPGLQLGYEESVHPDLVRALRRLFDSLTSCGVVHGDAQLHNFMLRAPAAAASGSSSDEPKHYDGTHYGTRELDVVAIDFGCAKDPADISNEAYLQDLFTAIRRRVMVMAVPPRRWVPGCGWTVLPKMSASQKVAHLHRQSWSPAGSNTEMLSFPDVGASFPPPGR